MKPRIAIVGSGPTGIYTLKGLLECPVPLSISIFEIDAEPGRGTPYHPDINDKAMLANIASIELPPVVETLTAWLQRQLPATLEELGVTEISDREFYPRLTIGSYFQAQLRALIEAAVAKDYTIDLRPLHRVMDIRLLQSEILINVAGPDGNLAGSTFDHVVMATGHNWPKDTEVKPGYFISPWPSSSLKTIGPVPVGILGTSLSALDALVSVATAHGLFYFDANGLLQYAPSAESERFSATLMSRKGILPEADFYFDFPFAPLNYFNQQAVDQLIIEAGPKMLDSIFELFKSEIVNCDPDYASVVGLANLDVESFAAAYFEPRETADPFVWAANNLAEAELDQSRQFTVPWRYAILRMHEVVARAVPALDATDLARFHRHFKTIFVDNYATVPHQSIHRLLALNRAEKIDILALGSNYEITTNEFETGATIKFDGQIKKVSAFIDATGQPSRNAEDWPFPTLVEQGVIKPARTRESGVILLDEEDEAVTRTGGVDLDESFRPVVELNLSNNLYCGAISFLLHKMPFVQGITSASEIGATISQAICKSVENESSLATGLQPIPAEVAITPSFVFKP